ncbi:MAG TPA: 4Fe-4S dicluster domain-containing protein [Vicinamibacteria bacterium]|nr:4Fe-4S dicluster domain-containing protein [Vicinamibacteria bacterium]
MASIEELGVVGAGGGGFPTEVKLRTPVPLVIVNGAECEPLLHKDKELLRHETSTMLSGLRLAMDRVGAREGVIGVKHKYEDVIASLRASLPPGVRVVALTDTYPAGDEFVLVHDVTGRVIPPGGLPRDVGALVMNVETLVNLGLGRPVTHKYLTVAGAVREPVTLRVPVGVSVGELIGAAGGATEPAFAVLLGGVMMARLARGLDEPITKTTGGVVVLPATHPLVRRHGATPLQVERIGRAACDQCRFCTEMCPRYLLGHPIEPHRAMQALGFTGPKERIIAGTLYCCECNLCTMFACPEDLDPKNVCVAAKPVAREKGLFFTGRPEGVKPHPLADQRRIPTRRLMAKLGIAGFRNEGPLEDRLPPPSRVVLLLKQHAGEPARPVVRPGEKVREGDVVAAPAEGALGARIHASIAGTVRSIDGSVVVEA